MKEYAAAGIRAAIQALDDKRKELVALLGRLGDGTRNGAAPDRTPTRRRRRRKMSAEARKRISEAQKARWAKQRRQAARS